MQSTNYLLLATNNDGKVRELVRLLSGSPYTLLRPSDMGLTLDVQETGLTFEDNARLKARAHLEASGLATLGEDSGLELDALGGEPGVLSARYHGLPDGPTKNAHILQLLSGVPPAKRACRYICVIVLIEPDGGEQVFRGKCRGRIAQAAAGSGGFGFDPIVEIPRLRRTVAELADEEKDRISHRGRAARRLLRFLMTRRPPEPTSRHESSARINQGGPGGRYNSTTESG